MFRTAQTEAEAGTIRNLKRRNAKIRSGAIAASWETFKTRTTGLRQNHPHYVRAKREHEERVRKIKRQYPL